MDRTGWKFLAHTVVLFYQQRPKNPWIYGGLGQLNRTKIETPSALIRTKRFETQSLKF